MGSTVKTSGDATRADALEAFRAGGLFGRRDHGATDPDDRYARHEHEYHKVLFCLDGSIVFHTDDGDVHARGR